MKINGSKKQDTLLGTDADDIIRGGKGDDRLYGGDGNDLMFGGKGNDFFVVNVADDVDFIADFQPGKDTIFINDPNIGGGPGQPAVLEIAVEYGQITYGADIVAIAPGIGLDDIFAA